MTKMIVALCSLANAPINQSRDGFIYNNLFPKFYRNQRRRVTLYWAILNDVSFSPMFVNGVLHCLRFLLWCVMSLRSRNISVERKPPGAICNIAFKYTNYSNKFCLLRLAYLQKSLLYQGLSVYVNSLSTFVHVAHHCTRHTKCCRR